MPIHLNCPNGHALRVKDKLAGKPGTCPTCGEGFVVPDGKSGASAGEAGYPGGPQAVPAPLASAPMTNSPSAEAAAEWRVTLSDGTQFGPTVPIIFAQWIAAGRVPADALVWRTGWDDWRVAGEVEAELPSRLPGRPTAPADLPVPEVPRGATLPPSLDPPRAIGPDGRQAPPTGVAYSLRKKREARRRRRFVTLLAVVCLALAAMLVGMMWMGPPPGAPVVPR